MTTRTILILISVLVMLTVCAIAVAQNPVRWSAPINEYPNPWAATSPPPNYYSGQYGQNYYGYPGYWYGYGGWPYGAYQGQYPNQPGYSGNPYYYYYGQ